MEKNGENSTVNKPEISIETLPYYMVNLLYYIM